MKIEKNNKGVVSIVALILFSLLMLFGIMVHLIISDTYQIITNSNSYFNARDITSSVSEYLKNEIHNNEEIAGFNIGPINCDTDSHDMCDFDFISLANNKDLELEIFLKGRQSDPPYVIPEQGYGQLTFGNTLVDNVIIPLAYINSDGQLEERFFDNGLGEISLAIKAPNTFQLEENENELIEIRVEGECGDEFCVYKLNKTITSEDIPLRINQDSKFYNLNSFDGLLYEEKKLIDYLVDLKKPVLKFRLIDQLRDTNNNPIPYLEYKITTNVPISYPNYHINIKAQINNNTYVREEYVDYPRNLLDSAVN